MAPPEDSITSLPPPPAQGTFWQRHRAKLIVSAIITVSIVYALHKGGLKFLPEQGAFSHVRWWTLPAYLVTLVAMHYFRAVRWRFLLRSFADVPRRRVVAVSWIGFAAILILPFRIGEIVRPYMIRERGKVSITAATGTVVAERVVDGLYLSIVLAIALLTVPTVHPLPERVVALPVAVEKVRQAGFMMLGLFCVAFTTIAVFYFARTWAHKATLAVFGKISRPLGEKLAGIAEKLADGLHFLGRARDALPFLLETTIYWGCNVLGMWLLAWGCGVVHGDGSPIQVGETCALMGMLGVTILVPGPPGLLGVFQLGIYAGMTMYFPTSVIVREGAAYVFFLYWIQVVWTLAAAGVFLVGNRQAVRALEAAERALPGDETAPAASEAAR